MTKNQKRQYIALTSLLLGSVIPAYSGIPYGYYESLEGLSGIELKNAVKAIARKNFTQIPYGTKASACTWGVFLDSDTRMENGVRYWWDMYSNNKIQAPDRYTRGDMNIEHAVPNSWWGGDTSIDAYVDIFHLNPSDATANNHKQNYPLGIVASPDDSDSWHNEGRYTTVGRPATASSGGATYVFEPADEYKGDFARAYFYIFTLYNDINWRTGGTNWMYDTKSDYTLKPWAYDMLLEWAKKDPVDQKEIDRNDAIMKHQGNRNPFIDCPYLAEYIWGDLKNTPYKFNGPHIPEEEKIKGYWYPVKSAGDINETDKYIIVSTSANMGLSIYEPGYDTPYYMMESYKLPEFETEGNQKVISRIPADMAVINLIKDGNGWKLRVSDQEGHERGYLRSTEAKKMNLAGKSGESGTTVTITTSGTQTSIQFANGAGSLKYNGYDTGRRFTTYTSGLESVMLYRYVGDDDTPGDGGEDNPATEYTVTEDFSKTNTGFPTGSGNKPAIPSRYTSKETGISYEIMGCYVNNYEAPYYLLVNGKNNEGAFISFTLKSDCKEIKMLTTSGCSTNPNSAVNVYADGHLIGKYAVNSQNATYSVEIPEEYREAGTVYKIESATTAYNQQFASFTYVTQSNSSTTSIEKPTEQNDTRTEIYTLDGIRLEGRKADDLPKGIYIIREGEKTVKKILGGV